MTKDTVTIPGTVFGVCVTLPEPTDPERTFDVGYDGECVSDYNNIKIFPFTSHLKEELIKRWRNRLLSYWGKVSKGDLSNMGIDFEDLFWKDLQDCRTMNVRKLKESEEDIKNKNRKPEIFHEHNISEWSLNVRMKDLQTIFDAKERTVCRMVKNCPLIDFAGPGRKVYQATVSIDHEINLKGLEILLLAGKLLYKNIDDALSETTDEKLRIEFYWVIPYGIDKYWQEKKSITIKETDSDKDKILLKKCWDEFVDQYVITVVNDEIGT